jgi:hypothetical protein
MTSSHLYDVCLPIGLLDNCISVNSISDLEVQSDIGMIRYQTEKFNIGYQRYIVQYRCPPTVCIHMMKCSHVSRISRGNRFRSSLVKEVLNMYFFKFFVLSIFRFKIFCWESAQCLAEL